MSVGVGRISNLLNLEWWLHIDIDTEIWEVYGNHHKTSTQRDGSDTESYKHLLGANGHKWFWRVVLIVNYFHYNVSMLDDNKRQRYTVWFQNYSACAAQCSTTRMLPRICDTYMS